MEVRLRAHIAGCISAALFVAWCGATRCIAVLAPAAALAGWLIASFIVLCFGAVALAVMGAASLRSD